MWENVPDFLELFRNFPVSISVLFVVPVVLLSGPSSTIMAAHEFPVFRMQQYDLHQTQVGSRSSLVNMEARPLTSDMLTRRCVVTRLSDLTIERFKEAVQTLGAGAILILLPKNTSIAALEQKEEWQQLERDLLTVEVPVAVYFAYEDKELTEIYKDIETAVTSDQAGSAFEALLGVTSTSGYQMVVNVGETKQIKDMAITSLQLVRRGIDEQLPTIAIVTHYDAFGIAPSLSFGADDNGSGVVALLELARLFSSALVRLTKETPKRLMKLTKKATKEENRLKIKQLEYIRSKQRHDGLRSFHGCNTRKTWNRVLIFPLRLIFDIFPLPFTETSVPSDVHYVLCLDNIGKTDDLFLRVSKPPKKRHSCIFFS
ncbi:unnamed protein product [Porites evermanni]|uniref:BOS complex subunit NCLN n=1 Tax=Porites evermanni TaxID=104178 RepID=A0ABN8SST6_9CNID|nr:unnamed protein product [Porites evermanni]